MASDRTAYPDPDTAAVMARDASACSAEAHLARTLAGLDATRRTVAHVPTVLLEAPAPVGRSAWRVTDSAARFAARLFD
jgi:hypothetical protein